MRALPVDPEDRKKKAFEVAEELLRQAGGGDGSRSGSAPQVKEEQPQDT
jgi:hypothetical protein